MRVQLLDRVAVVNFHDDVYYPPAKTGRLLAVLALRPGCVVPKSRLVEALWPECIPFAEQPLLRDHIRILRSINGLKNNIELAGEGYRIVVENPRSIDSVDFELSVREAIRAHYSGDVKKSLSLVMRGLSLWNSDIAMPELREESAFYADARRLDELQAVAQELHVECRLKMGEASEALADLCWLLARHPTREHLWGLCMIAQATRHRLAEVPGTYLMAHRQLCELTGLDPSPWLRGVYSDIMSGVPPEEVLGNFR